MIRFLIVFLLFGSGCAQKPVAKEPLIFMDPGATFERVPIANKKFERNLLYKAHLLDGDHITLKFEKLDTPYKYYPDKWKSDKQISIYYYGKVLGGILFGEDDSKEVVEANMAFLLKEIKGKKIYLPFPQNLIRIDQFIIIND